MKVSRVLVIYKKSVYELYGEQGRDPKFLTQLEEETSLGQRALEAHQDNLRSLAAVRAALDRAGVEHVWLYRARKRAMNGFDLVIAIGGDGTLLDASHAIEGQPVLGVNSSPRYSVGHFCAANAETFEATLAAVRDSALPLVELTRIRVTIEGRVIPYPALNEVLFAHPLPAATSRYSIRVGGVSERHKSSGVWISTAAGSTAAIRSAGGLEMDPRSQELQYRIREPYQYGGRRLELLHGLTDAPLEITSELRTAGLYIDGHRLKYNAGYGDRVLLDNTAPRLRLLRALPHAGAMR